MMRLILLRVVLLCLAVFLLSAISIAQNQPVTVVPGKWNVELYRDNPNYLQVILDMRSVHPKVHVRAVQGTATLYAAHNRFLKTAKISLPEGELTPGKVYVHYLRIGVSPVATVYGISASAKIVIYPPGVNPAASHFVLTEVKEHPAVPLTFDKNLKAPRGSAVVKLLSPRPPRTASR